MKWGYTMIVYNATKAQFNDDVNLNRISDIILYNLRQKNIAGGQLAEYHSWQNSLHFMRSAIDDPEIPGDVEVAIEYQIPRTSKRVDFMLAGADRDGKSNVVVVELKQWDNAESVTVSKIPHVTTVNTLVHFKKFLPERLNRIIIIIEQHQQLRHLFP